MNISGYTWGFNVAKKLFPFEACIKSMLLLANEVYVAYDPRYDVPEIFTQIDERVKVVAQEFDVADICKEGDLLTKARMCCSGDWLIWLDLDEILHEKDTTEILSLIQYAEAQGYTSLEIGFYQYISKKCTFPQPMHWCARPKIMKNIEGVCHGIDSRFLQQREDGTHYLSGGDGIDFIKDGYVFPHYPLVYRDFPLLQKLQDGTVTPDDIIRSTEYFPYIYHYARYSMQRKAQMRTGDRFTFWVGRGHDNFNPQQWIKDFEMPVTLEYRRDVPVEGSIGNVEPSHPQCMLEWVELMDSFMEAI